MPTQAQQDEATAFIETLTELGPIVQVREVRAFMAGRTDMVQTTAVQRWYTATWPRYEAACKAIGRNPFDTEFPDVG